MWKSNVDPFKHSKHATLFPNIDDTVGKVLRFSGLETIPNGFMATDSGSV